MLPNDRAQPAARDKPTLGTRALRRIGRAPFFVKLVLFVVLSPILFLYALGSGAVDVIQKRPGRGAAFAVATWAIPAIYLFSELRTPWRAVLVALPFAVAWAAGTRALARWYVPCRTTAWAMLWSLPIGVVALHIWPHQPLVGVIAAVLIAFAVVGWRLAKGVQDARMYPDGAAARSAGKPGKSGAAPPGDQHGGHGGQPSYGVRAQAAALPYAEQSARDYSGSGGTALPKPRPQISVEDAMAELDAMIGLMPVKEQVRSIAASIEAARRRAVAGVTTDKPMRHFVFIGPPGTGKTTLARVLAKIFYAFVLL